jgi:5-methylcytosine-specific restriction endonuclease McrA
VAKVTPSMAKNQMQRALRTLVDPYPTESEKNTLWSHFNNACAYCNDAILKESRTGHLDHAKSLAEGGNNDTHNFVLSCAKCNGDEKRELSWLQFLRLKCGSENDFYKARKNLIETWLNQAETTSPEQKNRMNEAQQLIDMALISFDQTVKNIRALTHTSTQS